MWTAHCGPTMYYHALSYHSTDIAYNVSNYVYCNIVYIVCIILSYPVLLCATTSLHGKLIEVKYFLRNVQSRDSNGCDLFLATSIFLGEGFIWSNQPTQETGPRDTLTVHSWWTGWQKILRAVTKQTFNCVSETTRKHWGDQNCWVQREREREWKWEYATQFLAKDPELGLSSVLIPMFPPYVGQWGSRLI